MQTTPGIIIGTIDESVGGDGVIADGSIKSVADLKGKTVAAEPNIPARLLLQMELKKAGLTFNDLQIKDIATRRYGGGLRRHVDRRDRHLRALHVAGGEELDPRRAPRCCSPPRTYRGIIIDVITARKDDLAANPKKYGVSSSASTRPSTSARPSRRQVRRARGAAFRADARRGEGHPQRPALPIRRSTEAKAYLGKPGERGKLHDIFDTVMELNLENGAADNKLDLRTSRSTTPSSTTVGRAASLGTGTRGPFGNLFTFRGTSSARRRDHLSVWSAAAVLLLASGKRWHAPAWSSRSSCRHPAACWRRSGPC